MWLDLWNEAVLPAFISVITVALTVLTGYATGALRRWGERQEAEWARAVMSEAAKAAEVAVAAVNQTFVLELKQLAKDGRLTPADAREAASRALSIAMQQLGEHGMDALARLLGGFGAAEDALEELIEAQVGAAKLRL